jgi:hypothetical protein
MVRRTRVCVGDIAIIVEEDDEWQQTDVLSMNDDYAETVIYGENYEERLAEAKLYVAQLIKEKQGKEDDHEHNSLSRI